MIKDDCIHQLKVLNARLHKAFEVLTLKCSSISQHVSSVLSNHKQVIMHNKRLKTVVGEKMIKIWQLEKKIHEFEKERDTRTQRLEIHELRFIHGLRTRVPKKYLSPQQKKKRLLFLYARQVLATRKS